MFRMCGCGRSWVTAPIGNAFFPFRGIPTPSFPSLFDCSLSHYGGPRYTHFRGALSNRTTFPSQALFFDFVGFLTFISF